MTERARAAAEHAARDSYGRLLALLAARCGDVALAEDALADAFEQALRRWPGAGVPANPDAWLLTVARNRVRDVWRSAAHRRSVPLPEDSPLGGAGPWDRAGAGTRDAFAVDPFADVDPLAIPDRRLALLFVCAHPAVAADVRTPLMLQTVLGLDSARVARVFAVAPGTMQQRLVRAKRRIAAARIPFVVPDRAAMAERLPPVLEAVYGCAAITWREGGADLAGEAQHLAVTLATLLQDEAEAWALASLVTLSLARRRPGPFVPLDEQDPADWDERLLADGEAFLRRAERPGPPGRFRLEAAIQAVHADRRRTGRTDWAALRTLYVALDAVAPSLGSRVALAAVVGRLDGAEVGLAALPPAPVPAFQPWWAARADLLARAGRDDEAAVAFARAAELADDVPVREHLLRRAAQALAGGGGAAPTAQAGAAADPTGAGGRGDAGG
ncbi:RNA polymerase sigma factor [Cellulomonas fimi]|uniref:Putative RNA polymerase, sigma-24 subunit, ECF subfamily n=1 Tax=Cellulomonas fimi (strain ATCC 484 / DSM 20113 / JCM 1341 / CCUG 24087 / LMG 16345 / NBRC 15513 / NCIMB 8980 / NCTC 7547 / NRS-133) TaxID=590998 RepID=F4GZR3_CELFA|nr:DUF6596 domain-containing protein [Cellulomonas fimi]AEE47229.1 putative RNA polymerase, sigma-24 subunit, ECF subfamily [Cellulomonas fimi ATCC 484]NNH08450.1 RNA polymerase subunit sigma-70 [Cellulomonas fimi]VEH35656.1 RNA polymerase sigma factor [Cellulomonas fimi]